MPKLIRDAVGRIMCGYAQEPDYKRISPRGAPRHLWHASRFREEVSALALIVHRLPVECGCVFQVSTQTQRRSQFPGAVLRSTLCDQHETSAMTTETPAGFSSAL